MWRFLCASASASDSALCSLCRARRAASWRRARLGGRFRGGGAGGGSVGGLAVRLRVGWVGRNYWTAMSAGVCI